MHCREAKSSQNVARSNRVRWALDRLRKRQIDSIRGNSAGSCRHVRHLCDTPPAEPPESLSNRDQGVSSHCLASLLQRVLQFTYECKVRAVKGAPLKLKAWQSVPLISDRLAPLTGLRLWFLERALVSEFASENTHLVTSVQSATSDCCERSNCYLYISEYVNAN